MATKGGGTSQRPSSLTPLLMMLLLVIVVEAGQAAAASPSASSSQLEQKCASEVGAKLVDCLAYAKGDVGSPSEKCCGSATDIRGKDPACLCYVIQQTYEGKPSFRGLGLQLPRLLQLPATCNIPNSNITDCPRLLNIKPSSPDYAVFNSTSAGANTTSGPSSAGIMNQVQLYSRYGMASAIASAIAWSIVL